MADQKVSNERRRELEQLDPFQENILKAMTYLKEFKKQLLLIAGAFVLVIVIFSAIIYSFHKAESNAAALVSKAMNTYAEINDPQKGYLEIKDDFQAVFEDFANTNAGRQAKVKYAKICYDASKFDQSYNYYKESLGLFKNEALMENFLLASLGHVSLAKNEIEEAKKYFLQIETSKTDLLKDEAIFALAMIYEKADNGAESKKMYEKIVTDYENSIYQPIAKARVDVID